MKHFDAIHSESDNNFLLKIIDDIINYAEKNNQDINTAIDNIASNMLMLRRIVDYTKR